MSLTIKDGAGVDKTLKTTADGADLIPHKIGGGIAVTSASYAPNATPGAPINLAVDKDTGGLLTHGRILSYFDDSIVVVGETDHDLPDSGLGVLKIGGKAVSHFQEPPTAVATGDRVGVAIDVYGRFRVILSGNDPATCYASAARTATPTVMAAAINAGARGGIIMITVTALTGSPSVTFTLEHVSYHVPTSYLTALERVVTATGTFAMKLYPGLIPVAGESANDILSKYWRLRATHGNADSITYVATMHYVP